MIGRAIGGGFAATRDMLARGLVAIGVTPNTLTLIGAALTAGAGVCLGFGAGQSPGLSLDPAADAGAYPLLAGTLLVLSSACDMLDGAVARIGNSSTRFGAFLDSTMDRVSDFAIFAGLAMYYATRSPANVTFALASMVAFLNAFLISYAKARAEDLIDRCPVGYWQRGERSAAVLIGTFSHNIPAMVVQQAISPAFTVLRRVLYTRARLAGRDPETDPRKAGRLVKLLPWRWPRMTVPYDIITGLNIAWLIFAPIPPADILRWLAG